MCRQWDVVIQGKRGRKVESEDNMMDGWVDNIVMLKSKGGGECAYVSPDVVLRTCSTKSGSNSITPTARKRSNILDFECRTRTLTSPRSSSGGDGFLGGLSTVVVGI